MANGQTPKDSGFGGFTTIFYPIWCLPEVVGSVAYRILYVYMVCAPTSYPEIPDMGPLDPRIWSMGVDIPHIWVFVTTYQSYPGVSYQ